MANRTEANSNIGSALPASDHSRTVLNVDLAALVRNWQRLDQISGSAECGAVIKANGYGLGQNPVARALWNTGCRTFFVASLEEALQARRTLQDAVIYVLDGLAEADPMELVTNTLRPVISNMRDLETWAVISSNYERRPPAGLMIDTGMNRLGLSPSEAFDKPGTIELANTIALGHVLSHLACADEPDHPKNAAQRILFARIRDLFPNIQLSLCNSSGIFLGANYHHELVRPGIALYGGRPNTSRPNPMDNVVTLRAPILQVRNAEAGDTAGYGATWQTKYPARLAIVACGYADGFWRSLGATTTRQGATAFIDGHPAPIVGRVSMDLLTINISDLPEYVAPPGAWVELIGPNASLDAIADLAGTISYEILTRLGDRCHRVYEGG